MASELDYRTIRTRVNEGLKKQKFRTRLTFFIVTLCLFVLFMALGWGMFLSSGGAELVIAPDGDNPLVGAMILVSMTGFMGLLFQAVGLALDTKAGEDSMRERLVAREISKAMMQMGMDEAEEKRKHMMRLSDDGELEEVVVDDSESGFRTTANR
ncbi:MAG: hypothetical protein R3E39_15655 [Anaerolineae bacterium]